jgi:hypothetical protein
MQKMIENGGMDKGTNTNCQRPQAHRRNKVSWAFDSGAAKRSHHATAGACASSAYPRLGFKVSEAIQTRPDSFNKA